LDDGNKVVNSMGFREFFYRIGLYVVSFLLLIAIIGVLIAKIVK
jgi:uncharacterized membrane protein